MVRRHARDRDPHDCIRGPDDAAALVLRVVPPDVHDGDLVIGIDAIGGPTGIGVRESDPEKPVVDTTQLIDLADELRALDLVLVTFVEDGALAPSVADVARYEGLRVGCTSAGITLLDHLLVSGHRWRSVREASCVDRDAPTGDPGASTRW